MQEPAYWYGHPTRVALDTEGAALLPNCVDGLTQYRTEGVHVVPRGESERVGLARAVVDTNAVTKQLHVEEPVQAGVEALVVAQENKSFARDHQRSATYGRSEERRVGKECRSRWWP